MSNLLELAIKAHGGLGRWNKVRRIRVGGAITGGIWYIKGRPDVLKDIVFELDPREQELAMSFPGKDKSTVFGSRLVTVKENGSVREYKEPKAMFAGQELNTPWEDVHVAYFSGEALWTYLTTPFLYSYPGFETEELDPWQENGEEWRRLKVVFPERVASHTREQVSYFGPDGLLRRHDYTVDILGGATGANYATDYRTVGGIVFPATRRVYAYSGKEHRVVPEPLLVAIDMRSIEVNEG